MQSVISFESRDIWRGNKIAAGSNRWRGNMAPGVMLELIDHFKPNFVVDLCKGSDTTGDVCRHLGIEYKGLDLYEGFDFTRDYALKYLEKPADLAFVHPPYHDMIVYSGKVHSECAIDGDISRCQTPEEFLEKSQLMLFNLREATKNSGIYAALIGDYRKSGRFYSFQSDYIQMMPKEELISVTIKIQHNCLSDNRRYMGNFVPIKHEYLIIWKKRERTLIRVAWDLALGLKKKVFSTWRNVIRMAFMRLGNEARLKDIYSEVEKIAGDMLKNNRNWQAKIRQQLQLHFEFVRKERGVWAYAA